MTVKFVPKIGASIGGGRVSVSSQHDFAESVRLQMNQIVDNFKGFVNSIETQSADILREALEPTMEMSLEICPHLTGDLRNSHYLESNFVAGHARVEMGYAKGGFPDYAVVVHEDLNAHHPEPTTAKFLQYPLLMDGPNIERRVQIGFAVAAGLSEEGGAWHG